MEYCNHIASLLSFINENKHIDHIELNLKIQEKFDFIIQLSPCKCEAQTNIDANGRCVKCGKQRMYGTERYQGKVLDILGIEERKKMLQANCKHNKGVITNLPNGSECVICRKVVF